MISSEMRVRTKNEVAPSLRTSLKKLEDLQSSDQFLLFLWIEQKDHETLALDGFMPFGPLLRSWIS